MTGGPPPRQTRWRTGEAPARRRGPPPALILINERLQYMACVCRCDVLWLDAALHKGGPLISPNPANLIGADRLSSVHLHCGPAARRSRPRRRARRVECVVFRVRVLTKR